MAPETQRGRRSGKGIASTGQTAPAPGRALINRLLWHTVTARHDRRAAETRNRFRPVAETLTYNADPGIAGSEGIGAALKAITGASRMAAAAERSGIMCAFANRIAAAMATASPAELPGILRTIKEQRAEALATAARNAKREGTEKRQAVLSGGQAQRPGHSSRRKPRTPRK